MMKMHTRNLIRLIKETVGGNPKNGAEIGVFRGENSEGLLKTFPDLEMVLVDTWREWEEGSSYQTDHKAMGRLTQKEWEEIRQEALKRVAGKKAVIFNRTSEAASVAFLEGYFDFVFLDANHTYQSVTDDIKYWLPKVRSGGLLCGHDYGGPYHDVAKAVNAALGFGSILTRGGRIWGYVKP
jgi:hypothetical protein